MGKLSDKVAVITGGSSGIGLETARRFIREGASVVIVGRRQKELATAVASIGEGIEGVQGDVANLVDLDRLYSLIENRYGRVDVVFANAGVPQFAPIGYVTEQDFDATFNINVKGVFFAVQKALPLMPNGSSIVLTSSVAGRKGMGAQSVYSATKAAVSSFARTWTADLKDRGIRVNTISPGPVFTPMVAMAGLSDEQVQNFTAQVPMGRFGKPHEIASAAVFLASNDSSFVTGIDLCVDGGMAQI
ncbi:MAG: SDR family oxidoreductase [Mycobacterium sp.]|nr:SDR family oxidoreductase [Mycobacterium sp.]